MHYPPVAATKAVKSIHIRSMEDCRACLHQICGGTGCDATRLPKLLSLYVLRTEYSYEVSDQKVHLSWVLELASGQHLDESTCDGRDWDLKPGGWVLLWRTKACLLVCTYLVSTLGRYQGSTGALGANGY